MRPYNRFAPILWPFNLSAMKSATRCCGAFRIVSCMRLNPIEYEFWPSDISGDGPATGDTAFNETGAYQAHTGHQF